MDLEEPLQGQAIQVTPKVKTPTLDITQVSMSAKNQRSTPRSMEHMSERIITITQDCSHWAPPIHPLTVFWANKN